MRFGIDIDITLVETEVEWWKWLHDYGNYYSYSDILREAQKEGGKLDYNLAKYFHDFQDKCENDPHNFWKQDNLYDQLSPLPDSVNVVKKLVDAGHEIVFISYCQGNHMSSKVRWLKKHFPFVKMGVNGGFLHTKEKHLVDVDVMIDDRIDNLLPFKDNVIKIYFGSIYQDKPFKRGEVDFITSDDCNLGWKELESYFEELEVI
ncbi:MAG: hypothetical protein [Cystoviridae sp.]|nr:MAG: hypothetical protein [Cystoviridae sp.]